MTGMGSDGVNGTRSIQEKGGQVYVQDEESSVGTPGQVAAAGLADATYPIASMAGEIVRRVAGRNSLSAVSLAEAESNQFRRSS